MGRSSKVVVALVVLFLLAGSAWAETLDFEDLCPPGYETLGVVPNPYHGFTFTGTTPGWITKNRLFPSGYQNTINGHVGIFTYGLSPQPITITRPGNPFDVVSMKIGAAWNDNQGVKIVGLINGALKQQVATTVGYYGETLTLNFTGIDALWVILTSTGTDHGPDDPGAGPHVVVDDVNLGGGGPPAEAPVANAGADQTVEQASAAGTQVTLDGSASTGAAPLTYAWYEGIALLGTGPVITPTLQLGEHAIRLEVIDANGANDSDGVVVTVEDTTAPGVTLTILQNALWPANHQLVLAATVSASDICDAGPSATVSVTSNEPINGPGNGNTDPDWLVVQNDGVWEVWLRAERAGKLTGRVYTITASADDASGNASTPATGTVTVPHDQKKK